MDQQEKMRQLLAQLWQQHYPAIQERIDILASAVQAARAGRLESTQKVEAESAAHKLAGVLGTFGREDGTKLARSIEKQLSETALSPSALDQLEALLKDLQQQISSKL